MYSTNNERKSVVAERFIRTLKTKIYKYMTSISKSGYVDLLDDIVNEYNNTYHITIKMKPVDVKGNTYIDSKKKVTDTVPWTCVINDLNGDEIIGTFYEKKKLQRLINKNLG